MPKIDRVNRVDASLPAFFSTQIVAGRRFFRARISSGRSAAVHVVSGGCERVASDYQVRRYRFPYYGVEFVAGGRGTLILSGRTIPLVPGTIFCYGPATAHEIRTDPARPLVKYFVDVSGRSVPSLLRSGVIVPGRATQTSSSVEIMSIFEDLIRNGLRDSRFTGKLCTTFFEALLLKIAETSVPLGSIENAAFGSYQRCREELESYATKLRSIQELADRCGLDEAYICRLFQRFDHETAYRRLMRLKMTEAAARLQSSPDLIKQVSNDFGFADQYHFSRVFKRVLGVSPRQFRQRNV